MSIFEHSRTKIFNPAQHPLQHDLSAIGYSSPRLPGVANFADALNYIVAVLYPNYIGTYATPAALPVSSSPNDYAVVTDDGDGNSAGYVWSVLDNTAQWIKRYDVDWSLEGIYAETIVRTQYLYVSKYGTTDKDAGGTPLVGLLAGQSIYGGDLANQNLSLYANAGDTGGGHTGYVQVDDTFRPMADSAYNLGTNSERWLNVYTDSLTSGTLVATAGSITDTSGAISFDNENLTTTGNITGAIGYLTSSLEVGPLVGDALILAAGSITDESGAISFGNENLTTTGTLASGTLTVSSDLIIATGSITSVSGTITFDNENLNTTGTLGAGNATFTRMDSDNVRIDGNTISVLDVNGNLLVAANGTGIIDLQSAATTLGITATGTVGVTGQLNVDNLRLDGNVISSTNLNGNITLTPNGSGVVEASSTFRPASDSSLDLGDATHRFNDLYIDGALNDATNSISIATLLSFRDALVGATSGMALFYDGAKWNASLPDTEITHGDLSGLSADDHLQYALLAGRSGGQLLIGSTLASEHLTLESTAHATKGNILFRDTIRPESDASYSGSWSGQDVGASGQRIRHVYSAGEFFGFRFQNATSGTLPSASATSVGRAVFATDNNKIYVDTGGSWFATGVAKFSSDTSWNGSDTTKDVTVSSTIADARQAIWQLKDNANDFDVIYCSLKAISATQVRITVSPALPAGSYRLIGVE